MDPEQLGRTLDLLVGQMGVISQQLKENQSDLAELRCQTTERFDHLERGRNQPPLYMPSRPPSILLHHLPPYSLCGLLSCNPPFNSIRPESLLLSYRQKGARPLLLATSNSSKSSKRSHCMELSHAHHTNYFDDLLANRYNAYLKQQGKSPSSRSTETRSSHGKANRQQTVRGRNSHGKTNRQRPSTQKIATGRPTATSQKNSQGEEQHAATHGRQTATHSHGKQPRRAKFAAQLACSTSIKK
ncbi:hypothetical protein M5K25_028476 [Dendrobium thyrsiflorum]|uniref:Uncharacterized protein n=1 Tax=Dendrobium thyrsiflorum TaxID=117978 RepID=A0ABD0TT14_DENTH